MRTLALRIQAYPSDLNPLGTVFGGWIMSMMDKAASIVVYVEADVLCRKSHCDTRCEMRVTDAAFTFVAVNKNGEPVNVKSVLRENLPQGVEKLL
ncbi:MAG: hotdog domain-containing protein [Campylobacterota bacterium]|nr:hotdog domain-containing protein [Campylobacterota bacterium]